MKRIALDTNAYSALACGNTFVASAVKDALFIGVPLPVVGEIYFGIYDGNKRSENHQNLERFLLVDRVRVLQPNEATASIFGEIATELKAAGKPIQQNDIWIAALCKQHDYTLLSRDKGFSNIIGLRTITFKNE